MYYNVLDKLTFIKTRTYRLPILYSYRQKVKYVGIIRIFIMFIGIYIPSLMEILTNIYNR